MLKNKSKIFVVLFICMFMISSVCFATSDAVATSEEDATAISEDESTVIDTTTEDTESQWVNADLHLTGDKVSVSKIVDGNAFIMANEVTIENTAEIGGDLFVCAKKLTIDGGYVYSNVFALAEEITVNGIVYDVYAACDTFTLESNGFVYRDLRVVSDNVNLNGKVRRNAYITADHFNFSEDTSSTIIYGNLEYSASSELTIPDYAVAGEVTHTKDAANTTSSNTVVDYLLEAITVLFTTFVIVVLLLWLAPNFVARLTNMGVKKSFASLGIGVATPVVAIILSVILAFSIIGVTLFGYTLIALAVLCLLATTITSLFIGGVLAKLLKKTSKVMLVVFTLLANLVIWGLSFIPYVGWVFSFIFGLFGMGATVVNIFCKKEWTKKEKKQSKKVTETKNEETK